jgi:hypothetical protein
MIKYLPRDMLKRTVPKAKIEKMLAKDISLKKAALSTVDSLEFLDKKKITDVAARVIKGYKERVKDESSTKSELKADPAQLVQRVQNEVVSQISGEIKDRYHGEFYIWLPSTAANPDPEHEKNYFKTFQIGVGEMPGERFGCQCGMEILVEETKLDL